MAQFKDFIEEGLTHGICPIRYADDSLSQLVTGENRLSAPGAAGYELDNDPDSISDFIAHLIHFSKLLEAKDPDTVAEWRGMLCEIFYSGLVSGGTVEIDGWTDLNNKSTLSKLFFDRFNTNNRHTGYGYGADGKPMYNEFRRFKKNGKAFAMLVPGVVILPLRKYDKTMFNASEWYNRDKQKWDGNKIIKFFHDKEVAEIDMFISYLLGIYDKCGNTAKQSLNRFIEDIAGDRDERPEPMQGANLLEVLKYGYAEMQEKNGVPGYKGNFFNDKILCFKSYFTGSIENESIPKSHTNAWDCYQLDTNGTILTPIKLSSFCRDDYPVYVIPPFNEEFLNAVKKGAVTNVRWSVSIPDTSVEATEIKISLTFDFNGKTRTIPAEFGLDKIVVADDLPYISMWPFVAAIDGAPEWKEYFIGIGGMNENTQARLDRPDYKGIDSKANQGLIKKLKFEDVKVSVFGDMTKYSIRTVPFGIDIDDKRSNFTMIKTEEFPEFIKLNRADGTALGCWQINKSRAVRLISLDNTKGIIGFDFATTATVEALSINGKASFIDGPGAYLYDVFNPFYSENNELESKRLWKMVQNYYFFGHNDAKCKKIFSYGQVNTAKDERGQEIIVPTNYVTGRPVFVTDEYLFRNIQKKADDVVENSAIKTPVKWPETANRDRNIKDENATNNFVLGCLTWGLLAARRRGCSKVNINLSLPLGKKSDTISVVMQSLASTLKNISGYGQDLTYQIYSEASANAKYLFDGNSKTDGEGQRWHGNPIPNPENGFMLVDLGGGTTDICVCQYYNDPNLPFEDKIKCETSFKYAGRELVDLSLLKNPNFKTMWIEKEGDIVGEYIVKQLVGGESATEAQKREPLFKIDNALDPIMDKDRGNLNQAIAFVSYILDNLRLTESAALDYEGQLKDIKYKFLAFFWVLGRYLRHIKDAGVVAVDNKNDKYLFKIYLTGCASKGIKTFCAPSDSEFVKKCRNAAFYGFHFDDKDKKEDISPKNFIAIEVIAGEEKKEVAYGLTAFDTDRDALNNNGDDDVPPMLYDDLFGADVFGTAPEEGAEDEAASKDATVVMSAEKATLLDCDGVLDENGKSRCRNYLRAIFSVVATLMGDPDLTYGAVLERHVKDSGENWIEEYIDNIEPRAIISPYISDKYIYEELLALFCFEKYCDLKGGNGN